MKILIIFTGGTIGSAVRGNYISANEKTACNLLNEYEKNYGLDFEYDTAQPCTGLSENNTGETICTLISCLKKGLEKNYGGVIITHGTDTLQYTAAALSYAFGKSVPPVCMVSANYILSDERSNGLTNFRGAVNFIKKKTGGVWVIYKNSDGEKVTVHSGSRLLESQAFSDCFYSAQNSFYGYFDNEENFFKNENYREFPDEIPTVIPKSLGERSEFILKISPYVGMKFPQITSEIKYVIMGSYHSGTVNTKSENARKFFEELKEKNIPVFLTGTTGGTAYESAKAFEELNIISVPDIAPIALYMKIWLAEAAGLDVKKIITKNLGGDRI